MRAYLVSQMVVNSYLDQEEEDGNVVKEMKTTIVQLEARIRMLEHEGELVMFGDRNSLIMKRCMEVQKKEIHGIRNLWNSRKEIH